jgi:hypothetical protein
MWSLLFPLSFEAAGLRDSFSGMFCDDQGMKIMRKFSGMAGLAAVLMAAAVSLPVHAQWRDGDVATFRLSIDASAPDAAVMGKQVRENPTGNSRLDAFRFGATDKAEPFMWASHQTRSGGFSYNAGGILTSVKGASQYLGSGTYDDDRQTRTMTIMGRSTDVLIVTGNFSAGKRQCAMWSETFSGNSVYLIGYYCSGIGQPLDMDKVEKTLAAMKVS